MAYDATRAQAARRLLEDEFVNELLQDIAQDQITRFINSEPGEGDIRDFAYTMLRMIEVFRSRLVAIAADTSHAKQSEEAKRMMS